MKRGVHISLDGINGSGKTTQVDMLASALRANHQDVVAVREPSDGTHGKALRAALFGDLPPPTDLTLLFALDRLDLARRTVIPALTRGAIVVQDRGYHASLAFQGGLLNPAWVREVNRHAPTPFLTIILAVPISVAAARIAARSHRDEFDIDMALARMANRVFRQLPSMLPEEHIVVIECGDMDQNKVHTAVADVVRKHLPGVL